MERTGDHPPAGALTRLRIASGFSIRQLGERASLHPTVVVRAERGGFVLPATRQALAEVLGPEALDLIAVRPPSSEHDTATYRARVEQGKSGRQVARDAGVPKDVYYRAERGEPVEPGNAKRIADALGLTVFDVYVPRGPESPRRRRHDQSRTDGDERAARATHVA